MHEGRCPRECAGPAAPLYPMLYFLFFMQGGERALTSPPPAVAAARDIGRGSGGGGGSGSSEAAVRRQRERPSSNGSGESTLRLFVLTAKVTAAIVEESKLAWRVEESKY